jgi:hypothetical protein
MKNFDESSVQLTPEEIDVVTKSALSAALQKKIGEEKTKAYWRKVSEIQEESLMNANQFKLKIENTAKTVYGIGPDGKSKLNIDEHNAEIFENIFKYFTQDPSGLYDLNKGLMLQGNVGTGKSKFMELFRYNQKSSYVIKSARTLVDEYCEEKDGGPVLISRYSRLINNKAVDLTFGQKEIGLCIDDVGTEREGMHYGTRMDVIQNLILNRYDRHHELAGKTHFTTNLTPSELEQKYGIRFRSRLNEMFNQIIFPETTPDRRRIAN